MKTVISSAAALTCLGDAAATFEALCRGENGIGAVRGDATKLGVAHGYPIDEPDADLRATRFLSAVLRQAIDEAELDISTCRVAVVVGTGLRELAQAERWWTGDAVFSLENLHFGAAVRAALPGVVEVLTLSNACSASGYALALAQDMIVAGEYDAVVAAGCDSVTDAMLAVLGRGGTGASPAVQPFDDERIGVLLGEGAAAVVVEDEDHAASRGHPPLAVLHGVGLSCDAFHETAPDPEGIAACVRDAFDRGEVSVRDVDLVVAHGTGTALNDPLEAQMLSKLYGSAEYVAVTGIKGSIGHTSGAAALTSLVVAILSIGSGVVPPVVGLRRPIPEAKSLFLVIGQPVEMRPRLAQVDAFGFGGVNAVALIGAAS